MFYRKSDHKGICITGIAEKGLRDIYYEKLGGSSVKHEKYPVENGMILAYEIMEKELHKVSTDICYDGTKFVPKINSENGAVSEQTLFTYHNSSGKKTYIMNMYTAPEYRRHRIWGDHCMKSMLYINCVDVIKKEINR